MADENQITTFPKLVLPEEKGSALTHAEMSGNFKGIRSFCKMLAGLFGKLFNTDGTLRDNSVTENVIKDRAVTQRKLSFTSGFAAQDTGAAGAFAIAFVPPCTAYANGMTFLVRAASTNSGAATLTVDGLAAVEVKKDGGTSLDAGDIQVNSVFQVVYFGGVFYLVKNNNSNAIAVNTLGSYIKYTSALTVVPAVGFANLILFPHGLGTRPDDMNVWLECIADDSPFVVGQRINALDITDATGNPAFTLTVDATNISVQRNVTDFYAGGDNTQQLDITTPKWKLIVFAGYIAPANTESLFVTAEFAVLPGIVCDVAHGLGGVPSSVRWVFVCKIAERGWSAGDELDAGFGSQGVAAKFGSGQSGANTTNVFLTISTSDGNPPQFSLIDKATGDEINIMTAANWRLKCYARS